MKDHPSTPGKPENSLDAAIDSIKADVPSAAEIASASERARAVIASQRGPQSLVVQEPTETGKQEEGQENPQSPASNESWDSIDDYIAAIPAYLAKQLTSAQTMLFEEETRQSIPLRRALVDARERDSDPSAQLTASTTEGSSRY